MGPAKTAGTNRNTCLTLYSGKLLQTSHEHFSFVHRVLLHDCGQENPCYIYIYCQLIAILSRLLATNRKKIYSGPASLERHVPMHWSHSWLWKCDSRVSGEQKCLFWTLKLLHLPAYNTINSVCLACQPAWARKPRAAGSTKGSGGGSGVQSARQQLPSWRGSSTSSTTTHHHIILPGTVPDSHKCTAHTNPYTPYAWAWRQVRAVAVASSALPHTHIHMFFTRFGLSTMHGLAQL